MVMTLIIRFGHWTSCPGQHVIFLRYINFSNNNNNNNNNNTNNNDITLGRIRSVVASDVELFKVEENRIGLDLNVSKCESISRSHDYREQAFQGFLEIAPVDACLLGPIMYRKSP